MPNIFTEGYVPVYPGGWSVIERRPFNQDEKDTVSRAVIVTSNYGLSVCFVCKEGGKVYIPLSINSKLKEFDILDMDHADVLTLKRGSDVIYRVEESE